MSVTSVTRVCDTKEKNRSLVIDVRTIYAKYNNTLLTLSPVRRFQFLQGIEDNNDFKQNGRKKT